MTAHRESLVSASAASEAMARVDNITSHTLPGLQIQDHFTPLLSTFYHIPILMTTYLLVAKIFGPKLMSDREPFQLRTLMMIYNLAQVCINSYLLYLVLINWGLGILKSWNFICKPVTETAGLPYNQTQSLVLQVMYYYYLNKIMDLFDTVFFVLRKKQSQVTFLHLFHHSTMIVSTWVTIVYFREEAGSIMGVLNFLVHIFMYLYYFLSSFGPTIQKYLWWKKHLTKMQLVQFIMILAILAKMKLVNCQCSPWFWALWACNISVFLCLFLNFYIKSYRKKTKIQ